MESNYQHIKQTLLKLIDTSIIRKIVYIAMDLTILRQWYVKKNLVSLNLKTKKITVLDAGCGFGQYSIFCSKHFPKSKITAIDLQKNIIESNEKFAQKNNIKNINFTSLDILKLKNQKFDLILLIDVLEHIKKDIQAFNKLCLNLKKNGFIIFHGPTKRDLSVLIEHEHNGYDIDGLIKIFAENKLRIIRTKSTYGFWGQLGRKMSVSLPLWTNKHLSWLAAFTIWLLLLPIFLLFMTIDFLIDNKYGSGILLVAKKV